MHQIIQQFFLFVLAVGIGLGGLKPSYGQESANSSKADENPLLKVFEPRSFSNEAGATLNYRLMKPINYEPGKKYPLVIFLHGAGERGEDNLAQLKHGAKDFASESLRKQYPAYWLAPQCPQKAFWANPEAEGGGETIVLLKGLIDEMIATAGIDTSRVYITGLSMGGFGTWDLTARYENFFAAAAPVCGGGNPENAAKLTKLPIWCFHGAKDGVVRPERSREMIEAIKAAGGSPKYTEYPEAGHDSWTATYSNPELYEWLFAQKKPVIE